MTANAGNKKAMMRPALTKLCCLSLATLLSHSAGSGVAHAQDLNAQRSEARRELEPLFMNKYFEVDAQLTESSGPERWRELFGKPLVGCPGESPAPADSVSLEFTSSSARAWAGDLDGINTETVTAPGFQGGGLAVPSNSGNSSGTANGPAYLFSFEQTGNVARAAIDNIARELDRCLSALPPGNYPGDQISRLCPYPEISPADLKQTCVTNTYGDIREPLADGTGYKVTVHENLMCDGVGYGRAQPGNPGWVSCYHNTYEGKATITSGKGGPRVARLRAASKAAEKRCARNVSRGNRSARARMNVCAARSIARTLTAKAL